MIERDLNLRRSHAFVRRQEALRQQLALCVADEKHDVPVAIVLADVLSERVQRFRRVSNGREYS